MYGYVTPIKDQMNTADFMLYRAYYCGICKATGKMFGQLPRFTTNYDIVFLSLLLHDFTVTDVTFETKGCVCNPFKKKVTVCRNELLDKIVNTNIIMSYWKMRDGVIDKEGFKSRVALRLLSRPYKKARKAMPKIDEIVRGSYNKLFEMEKSGAVGIDRVSDCFARLLQDAAKELIGDKADENILKLCYNVGKFVYLADALDDIDEDFKQKRYNPFLAAYGDFTGRKEFFEKHKDELSFILSVTVNRAIECFNKITFTQSSDLLRNVLHKGLRGKVDELFKSTKKLPKPKL